MIPKLDWIDCYRGLGGKGSKAKRAKAANAVGGGMSIGDAAKEFGLTGNETAMLRVDMKKGDASGETLGGMFREADRIGGSSTKPKASPFETRQGDTLKVKPARSRPARTTQENMDFREMTRNGTDMVNRKPSIATQNRLARAEKERPSLAKLYKRGQINDRQLKEQLGPPKAAAKPKAAPKANLTRAQGFVGSQGKAMAQARKSGVDEGTLSRRAQAAARIRNNRSTAATRNSNAAREAFANKRAAKAERAAFRSRQASKPQMSDREFNNTLKKLGQPKPSAKPKATAKPKKPKARKGNGVLQGGFPKGASQAEIDAIWTRLQR